MKYIARYVKPSRLKDFDGMNYYASERFGYGMKHKDEIHVKSTLSKKDREKVFRHEVIEAESMKSRKDYWNAHTFALSKENNKTVRLQSGKILRF